MSEERDRKDERRPDAGPPRVPDRRGVRAGEGGARARPVATLPPPSRASFFPRAPPPGGRSPTSSLRGVRLPQLPGPESSRASGRRDAQAGGREFSPSVTCGGASGRSGQPQSSLLPRLRRAGLPAAAPWRAAASSSISKLPVLQAAASSTPSRGRARAVGIRGSRLPVLAPRPHVQDGTARAESQGPALEVCSTILMPQHDRPRQNYMVSLSCAAAASPRVEVQLAVPGRHAPTSNLRTPGKTSQVLFTKAGKIHAAWRVAQEGTRDTRAAATPSSRAAQKGPEGQAGGKERDKEPLSALVPADAGNLVSPKAAHSPEANDAVLFPRVCKQGKRDVNGTTMPEVSRQAAPRLQDPREVNWEAYGCSPVHPAIWRIRDQARKEQMLSSWSISWPDTSMLRLLRAQAAHASASATDTAQGMLDTCTTTSRVEGHFPVPGEFLSCNAGARDEQHDLEEIAETETAGQSSGDLQSACLAPSDEAEAVRSASLLDAAPGPAGQLEPLPTSVPADLENSDSFETVHCPDKANAVPFLLSACKRGEGEETAMVVEKLSTESLGGAPKLQDPRDISQEACRCSPVYPAIRRILDEVRREQMLSSWNISWPNNMVMLRLLRAQAAHASASATDTAQGMLDTCTTTSVVEDHFPAPGEFLSCNAGVQEEQHYPEDIAETETAGQSSGDLQSACLAPSDEAEAVHSASLLDAGPGPAGQLEPLSASVPEDTENSGCSMAVNSPEVASEAPFFLSAWEEGETEEPAMAVSESSKQSLGETPSLLDPREVNWEAYGCSPVHPAIWRIRDQARKEQMLSSWNISWPDTSMLRLLRAQAAHASASATAQGMLDICTTTSRVEGLFPASCDSQSQDIRIQHAQEETTDDAASDASTDRSMLDARDNAVTAESMPTPSCFCPDTMESVEEWEDNSEEAAAEAAGVPPSISDASSVEMKTAAARHRMPAVIRTVLRALRRIFTCSCVRGQRKERHEAANTTQLPRDI